MVLTRAAALQVSAARPCLFDLLADDLVLEVLKRVDGDSLSHACSVCAGWHNIEKAHSQELWKAAIVRFRSTLRHHERRWSQTLAATLEPGSVHERLNVSFKKSFAMIRRAHQQSMSSKTAAQLNKKLDWFVQIQGYKHSDAEQEPTRYKCKPCFRTVKMRASGTTSELSFELDEDTTIDIEPEEFEVYAQRRSDGAVTRVISSIQIDDVDFPEANMALCLCSAVCDVLSYGDARLHYRLQPSASFSISLDEDEDEDEDPWSQLWKTPRVLKKDSLHIGNFAWRVYSHDWGSPDREEDFDVTQLYNVLHGHAATRVVWT